MDHYKIGRCIAMMSTSNQLSGKCVPTMAETIISMCSRTWNQERRIGVLLRTIETPLSVWDCIPEQLFDAHLKDAVYKARFWLMPPLLTLLVRVPSWTTRLYPLLCDSRFSSCSKYPQTRRLSSNSLGAEFLAFRE